MEIHKSLILDELVVENGGPISQLIMSYYCNQVTLLFVFIYNRLLIASDVLPYIAGHLVDKERPVQFTWTGLS